MGLINTGGVRRLAAGTLAVVGVAAVPSTTAASSHSSPDVLTAHITGAGGAYHGDSGTIVLHIATAGRGASPRPVTVRFRGRLRHGSGPWRTVKGTVRGALVDEPAVPDIGSVQDLSATGTIKPLARVTATGKIYGTGFIEAGRERIHLRLLGPHGTLTLDGQSGLVPGFTSP